MEKSPDIEAIKLKLTEYLTRHGLRKTPERYAILEAIYEIEGHFSAENLYARMGERGHFRVSRATIYNNIDLLVEANLVVKNQFGASIQYEAAAIQGSAHHHLICTQCGKVQEFENEELQAIMSHARYKRFTPSHYALSVYGLCTRCLRANQRRMKEINNKKEK